MVGRPSAAAVLSLLAALSPASERLVVNFVEVGEGISHTNCACMEYQTSLRLVYHSLLYKVLMDFDLQCYHVGGLSDHCCKLL